MMLQQYVYICKQKKDPKQPNNLQKNEFSDYDYERKSLCIVSTSRKLFFNQLSLTVESRMLLHIDKEKPTNSLNHPCQN